MKIDAHQHFWQFDPIRDAWISEEMGVIRRDFMPEDLQPILQSADIQGCIAVQADQSETETHFLLDLAQKNDFIQGVVGWVDLRSPKLEARLEYFSQFPVLKGFRHILQGEKPEFMLQKNFIRGIKLLKKYNFRYDVLVFPHHLPAVKEFLQLFDNQPFIIDHLAKPYIKKGEIEAWAKDIKEIAQFENVYCKISGMVTEADWQHWQAQDFKPYLDLVTEAFGNQRLIYGSDWPVCLLAANYTQQLNILKDYFADFSEAEKNQIFGGNAVDFYNL
jgi:L-fuconolactonase